MGWSDPNELSWAEGSPLTAADMISYVKNNLLALRALNVEQTVYLPTTIATNSNSFVDVDPLNLKVALDISSDKLLVLASFVAGRDAGGTSYYDLIVNQDASTNVRAGDVTNGLVQVLNSTEREVLLVGFWTGLQPGTKTVRLQMRSSNSSYARVHGNMSVVLTAFEV